MHQQNTVVIPTEPTEKCINEMRAALVNTGAMGLRRSCDAIYKAIVNHGALK
jgi:hypothetical protein